MTHRTHCWLRNGDNLVHLHFLRKLALAYPDHTFEHRFATHLANPLQLADIAADVPNIRLLPQAHEHVPAHSVDGWKGANGYWYQHPRRHDYAAFYLEFWGLLARTIGLESPVHTARDLLFDYPRLRGNPTDALPPCDVLVINSSPLSGQWRAFDGSRFDAEIVHPLVQAGHRVITSTWSTYAPSAAMWGLNFTRLGQISTRARAIVMVSTGPSWPTFNLWTHDTLEFRLVLLDEEDLSGLALEKQDRYAQTNSIDKAREMLRERGWT